MIFVYFNFNFVSVFNLTLILCLFLSLLWADYAIPSSVVRRVSSVSNITTRNNYDTKFLSCSWIMPL